MSVQGSLRSASLVLSIAGLSACASPIEGTWVFQWDRSSIQELYAGAHPLCEEPDDSGYPQYVRDGNEYTFVEIYSVKGEGIVVVHEGEEFIGESEGTTFTVEAKYAHTRDASSTSYFQYDWVWKLDGEYSKGEMTGKEDREEYIDESGSKCHYKSRRTYTGVKLNTRTQPERGINSEAGNGTLGLGDIVDELTEGSSDDGSSDDAGDTGSN